MSTRQLLLIALACACIPSSITRAEPATGIPAAGTELDRQRATFQVELQKINDADLADRLTIQNQYLKTLERVEKQFQAAGQLEPLLAVRNEHTRFEAERDIIPSDMSAIPELKACQATFLQDRDALPIAHARRMVILAQQYDQSLGKLQAALTKKAEVEAAIEVKRERDSIANTPAIRDARAAVEEADAKAKADKPVPKLSPAPPAATPSPLRIEKKPPKYSGKPEFYIRARFEKLCDILLDHDWERATTFVNPVFIKRRGIDGVIMQMRRIFPFLQGLANLPRGKIKGGDVKLDSSGKTAMLTPKVWFNDRWHELPNHRWTEVDGEWYLEIEPVR